PRNPAPPVTSTRVTLESFMLRSCSPGRWIPWAFAPWTGTVPSEVGAAYLGTNYLIACNVRKSDVCIRTNAGRRCGGAGCGRASPKLASFTFFHDHVALRRYYPRNLASPAAALMRFRRYKDKRPRGDQGRAGRRTCTKDGGSTLNVETR